MKLLFFGRRRSLGERSQGEFHEAGEFGSRELEFYALHVVLTARHQHALQSNGLLCQFIPSLRNVNTTGTHKERVLPYGIRRRGHRGAFRSPHAWTRPQGDSGTAARGGGECEE